MTTTYKQYKGETPIMSITTLVEPCMSRTQDDVYTHPQKDPYPKDPKSRTYRNRIYYGLRSLITMDKR